MGVSCLGCIDTAPLQTAVGRENHSLLGFHIALNILVADTLINGVQKSICNRSKGSGKNGQKKRISQFNISFSLLKPSNG